ncbi:MAG TPA: IS1595 family transposase [Bacteroidia bacterium]
MPLTKWFQAIYYLTTIKRGVSSYQMAKWLGISQPSAWFLLHRLREALKDENNILLEGIVEADETFVGPKINRDTRLQREQKKHFEEQEAIHGMSERKKRRQRGFPIKSHRQKGVTKAVIEQRKLEKGDRKPFEKHTIVLGATEQPSGKVILKKIGHSRASINKGNIFPHLEKHISSDSILITDQLSVYKDTKDLFADHKTVNHDETYVTKDGIHINTAENLFGHLKRMIDGTYFHFSRWHFDRYLDEFTYRWNRRKESEKSLFDSFIKLVSGKRIKYEELIDRKNKMAA